MIADEILKNVEFDTIRLVYNKFASVVSFQPSIATILSPEVRIIYSNLLVVDYIVGINSEIPLSFSLFLQSALSRETKATECILAQIACIIEKWDELTI